MIWLFLFSKMFFISNLLYLGIQFNYELRIMNYEFYYSKVCCFKQQKRCLTLIKTYFFSNEASSQNENIGQVKIGFPKLILPVC